MNNKLACGSSAVALLDLRLDLRLDGDFASLIDLNLFSFFCSSGSPLLLPFWFWRTHDSVSSEPHASTTWSSFELIVLMFLKDFGSWGGFGFSGMFVFGYSSWPFSSNFILNSWGLKWVLVFEHELEIRNLWLVHRAQTERLTWPSWLDFCLW